MSLRNKIFEELRRLNFAKDYLWKFQQYWGAFAINLNSLEQKEFQNTMIELCDDGLFQIIDNSNPPQYRLTEKGETVIWSEQ